MTIAYINLFILKLLITAYLIILIAAISSILLVSPSITGSLIAPNPRADTFQLSLPNFLYRNAVCKIYAINIFY